MRGDIAMHAARWKSTLLSRAIAVCVVLAPLSVVGEDDAQQRYGGRTVSEWRTRIGRLDFTDPLIKDDVPGLIELVRDPAVPEITRRQAAVTLARIGEPAQDAIPLLISLAGEPSCETEQSSRFWALKAATEDTIAAFLRDRTTMRSHTIARKPRDWSYTSGTGTNGSLGILDPSGSGLFLLLSR